MLYMPIVMSNKRMKMRAYDHETYSKIVQKWLKRYNSGPFVVHFPGKVECFIATDYGSLFIRNKSALIISIDSHKYSFDPSATKTSTLGILFLYPLQNEALL